MKPSGIEWIGDIPDDWEVRKGKFLFKQRNSRGNTKKLELLSPTQKYGVIPQSKYEELTGMKPVKLDINADLASLKTICNGDYCISLRSFQGGFEYSSYEGVVSPAYQVFYPTKLISRQYYKYLFKVQSFIDKINSYAMSLRDGKNISFEDFSTTYLPFPPLKTQQKIADYLDKKCGEIDATIAKQKEIIEKLKAYKQSLISETVTKGLDKSAPLKPSGIEWIGDIPAHWEVIKTKFLFNVYGGSTPKVNVPEYWGDKITWITPGELGDDIKIVLNSKRMLSEKGLNSCGATLVSKGSIIISNRAPIGQVCLAGSELCTNQGCKSLVAKIKLSCLFFYYFFKVQSEVLNMLGNGTTFMELSTSDLLNFKIPCPTIKEQQKIADYLDSKCSQIDKYITEKQNIIQKLDAYKKSLIFECITGKHKIY